MADALKVMRNAGPQASADDQHIAGAHAAVKPAVDQHSVKPKRRMLSEMVTSPPDQHDAARDILGMNEIESARKQQTRGETGLHAHSLLMKITGQPGWRVQVKPPADEQQRNRISAQKGEQDASSIAHESACPARILCAIHCPV